MNWCLLPVPDFVLNRSWILVGVSTVVVVEMEDRSSV